MKNRWTELLRAARKSPEYRADLLKFDVSVQLRERLGDLDISQAELAKRLGVSEAAVSKLLRGTENHTLSKLVEVADKLGLEVDVRLLERMKIEGVRHVVRAYVDMSAAIESNISAVTGWTKLSVQHLKASNQDRADELESAAA